MIFFQKLITELATTKLSKRILFGIFIAMGFLCMPNQVKASHIIGGEMNYSCMGGDNYEITLTVYRDCFYANPLALFDDPAAIGIFDSDNNLVDSLMLNLMNNDTLTPILSDSCLFVPNDVCVHTTTYRRTVNLPFRMGGYILSYQRCCRNQTITNIVDPSNTGATFQAILTEKALIECNSGAEFMDWPPLYICVNEPIFWDHSATDSDGDSLVYRLCTPNDGADFFNNKPQPPNPPPYGNVTWIDSYDESNLLGGEPLTIDPNTGALTGTPNTIGQFVVGVCIEEYRDGVLIAAKTRDFQYNVGQCLEVNPMVGNAFAQCEDLSVDFINTSTSANNFLWQFGDPDNPDASSTEREPNYVYPDTGFYDITLIAEPYGACADTTVHTMYLKESTLTSDYNFFILECADSVILSVNNTSFDTYSDIIEYNWTLSDGQTSTDENPVFSIAQTEELTLTLTAVADDGCQESLSETFFANVLGNGEIVDTLVICPGASVSLNNSPFESDGVLYDWSPAIGLDDTSSSNPVASPSESTIYQVVLNDTINDCTGNYRVLVQIQENGGSILTNDTTYCSNNFTIQADSNAIVSMTWNNGFDLNTSIGNNAAVSVDDSGNNTYFLSVIDELGCTFTDSIQLVGGTINLDLNTPEIACVNTELNVGATNLDAGDELTFAWTSDLQISDTNAANTVIALPEAGAHPYTLTVQNQYACEFSETSNLFVLADTAPTGFDMYLEDCEGFDITFTNTHINAAYYQWDLGDGAANASGIVGSSANYTYTAPGIYTITLSPIADLPCDLDTYQMEIEIPAQPALPNYEIETISCGLEAELTFNDATQSFQGAMTQWLWDFGNGMTSTEQNPTFTFTENNISSVNLTVTTELGCVVQADLPLDLSPYLVDLNGLNVEPFRCSTDPFELNPNGNEDYTYQWSPANTLDNPTAANPISSATEATTYTLMVTNSNGCQAEQTINLSVADNLLDAEFSWTYSDCVENAIVNFQSETTYSEGPVSSIQWMYNDGEISNEPNFTTNFDSDLELEISLMVVAEDGCLASNTQSLNIALLDLDLPTTSILCNGSSTQLNAAGNPDYNYSWSPATGLSDVNAAMPIANPTESTVYTVTVFDANTGCEVAQNIMLEVPEPLVANAAIDYSDCTGPAVGNFVSTTEYSSDITNVEWSINNGASNSEFSPAFSYNENTSVEVQLIVTAENGCVDTVQQNLDINIITFEVANDNIIVCTGTPTELNPNPNPNLQYSWSPNTGINNMNTSNPLASPDQTTTYVVTITDSLNGACSVEQEVLAAVPEYDVNIDFVAETIECEDELNVQFMNTSLFENLEIVEWEWQFSNGQTSILQEPVVAITEDMILTVQLNITVEDGCTYALSQPFEYNVSMTDLSFLNTTIPNCADESIALNPNANPSYQYEWSPSADFVDTNNMNPNVSPSETTTYTVMISHFNGIDTCRIAREVTVEVETADLSFLAENVLACAGTSVQLNDNAQGNFSYNWNPTTSLDDGKIENPLASPLQTTMYNVTLTNNDGIGSCAYETVVTAVVPEVPILEIVGEELNCVEEATMTALTNPTYGVVWSDSPTFDNVLGTDIPLTVMTSVVGEEYFVQVTDNNGCTNVDSITIYNREIDIELIEMENVCVGDTFEIQSINLDPFDELEYVWSPSSPIISGQGTESIQFIPTGNTTFSLTASNQFGCETTETVDLDVTNLSDFLEISSNMDTIVAGEQVELMVSDDFGVSYEWAPPVYLDDPNSPTPIATPTETTMFIVGVQDENGCVGTATHLVVVLPSTCDEPFVFIPNSFTPNGDGVNEELLVQGHPIKEMHLVIYNRWGQKVFESNSKDNSWDGTFEGKELEPDVFAYYLEIECFNGDNYFKKGNVSLIR